jgi:hypothetical protein
MPNSDLMLSPAETAACCSSLSREPLSPDQSGRAAVLGRKALAEFTGTDFLVAAVVGSGIAAARLSPHDVGLELLENAVVTGGVRSGSSSGVGSLHA